MAVVSSLFLFLLLLTAAFLGNALWKQFDAADERKERQFPKE